MGYFCRAALVIAQQTPQPTAHTPITDTPQPTSHTPLIEATGWQMTPTGEVILVATISEAMVPHPLNQPVTCQGRH